MNVVLFQHVNELGEGRCNPHASLVFNTLNTLLEHLLDNHSKVVTGLLVLCLSKIHKHRDKGSLSVGGKQGYNLVLYALYATVDFSAES